MVNQKTLRISMVKSLGMLWANRGRTSHSEFELLIKEELETLPVTQTRRLFELRFWDIESQVRKLAAELAERTWAQQRRVIGLKQGIEHYGAVKAR
jgi:hypothetical protein